MRKGAVMYDQTITIVNKVKKADTNGSATDLFVKTVISNAEHRTVPVKTVTGNVVNIGETHQLLIPFAGNNYLPYKEWVKDTTKGFTSSVGDYIFFGTLSDPVTSANITTLRTANAQNVCEIRSITEARNNGLATVQLKIEGV